MGSPRYIPLFWRLFVPNATVLAVASVILTLQPPNGRVPVIAAGLLMMLGINLALMRYAVAPLDRLTGLMRAVDPLRPGQRLPVPDPSSEVSLLTEAFNEMLGRLEDERRDSARRALSEREGERRGLAAELHDEIGQNLTALALQLDRLYQGAEGPAREEIGHIRDDVLEAVEETRRLARKLRPEALDALGLVPALTNLCERIAQQTGVDVVRHLDRNLPELGPDAELVIYRVAQESITNSVRHSGATYVEVGLRASPDRIVLTIRDDGRGIVEERGTGSGIRTMRERALLIGATLHLGAREDGTGTEVRLEYKPGPS